MDRQIRLDASMKECVGRPDNSRADRRQVSICHMLSLGHCNHQCCSKICPAKITAVERELCRQDIRRQQIHARRPATKYFTKINPEVLLAQFSVMSAVRKELFSETGACEELHWGSLSILRPHCMHISEKQGLTELKVMARTAMTRIGVLKEARLKGPGLKFPRKMMRSTMGAASAQISHFGCMQKRDCISTPATA